MVRGSRLVGCAEVWSGKAHDELKAIRRGYRGGGGGDRGERIDGSAGGTGGSEIRPYWGDVGGCEGGICCCVRMPKYERLVAGFWRASGSARLRFGSSGGFSFVGFWDGCWCAGTVRWCGCGCGECRGAAAVPAQGGLPAEWDAGVKVLAGKIAVEVKPARAVSLEVKNISSLGAAEVEAIRAGLEGELRSRGMRVRQSGEIWVVVTLSENEAGFVWVAEISRNEENETKPQFAIVSGQRAHESRLSQRPIPLLQRRVVWRQKEPILDFATRVYSLGLGDITYATILEPTRLRALELRFPEWSEINSASIAEAHGPRDLRGILVGGPDGSMKAYAGNTGCIDLILAPYCGENPTQDWPFPSGIFARFRGDRNFFTGIPADNSNGIATGKFYSAAIGLGVLDHYTPIITPELDGVARLHSFTKTLDAAFSGWGDDIASIKPTCGAAWQILVTGTGDWTEPDHINVYEVSFGVNSATTKTEGQPLEFPGPILALWQADDEKSARVVSKNLQTGMYEASIVTVSCSQ